MRGGFWGTGMEFWRWGKKLCYWGIKGGLGSIFLVWRLKRTGMLKKCKFCIREEFGGWGAGNLSYQQVFHKCCAKWGFKLIFPAI